MHVIVDVGLWDRIGIGEKLGQGWDSYATDLAEKPTTIHTTIGKKLLSF